MNLKQSICPSLEHSCKCSHFDKRLLAHHSSSFYSFLDASSTSSLSVGSNPSPTKFKSGPSRVVSIMLSLIPIFFVALVSECYFNPMRAYRMGLAIVQLYSVAYKIPVLVANFILGCAQATSGNQN